MQSQNKDYRWNFTVNLIDGASYWLGASFISSSTIFPLFISKLTSSLFPIGLVSVIVSAGWFLPQLISARVTESHSKMKTIVVNWGLFLERLPIFIMVIIALFAGKYPQIALISFLLCLTWFNIGAGVIAPSWMALIGKIFSPEKRGSFMGTTMFLGSTMGILGSLLSAWLLRTLAFPTSFVLHFVIAAVCIFVSWIFLGLTREPNLETDAINNDWGSYKKDLIKILKNDHNFRRYIIASIITTIGGMGTGFFTISAIRRFDVSDSTVGFYTLAMLLGQTAGNLVLGWLADKYGHKQSLEIGAAAILLAFILALVMPSPTYYFLVFVLFGINLSSGIVSGILVVLEFCEISRIPTYSGLANTARGVVGLFVPLIATQIARVDYSLLFGLCAAIILFGLVLLKWWVKEPRWNKSNLDQSGEPIV